MGHKGTTVEVWFYIAEPNHDKAVEEIEKLIQHGLKRDKGFPPIHYVAEVLK